MHAWLSETFIRVTGGSWQMDTAGKCELLCAEGLAISGGGGPGSVYLLCDKTGAHCLPQKTTATLQFWEWAWLAC